MISKYLKTKNLISKIKPIIDENELLVECREAYYYLNSYDCKSSYYYYRGLFNNYDLEKLCVIGNKLPKIKGELSSKNSLDLTYRESTISWVPINDQTEWIYKKIIDCVNTVNNSYFNYDLTKIEKLQFTRYYGNNNSFYSPHVDSNFGHFSENRKLTFVLQLSDPTEYEGGELRLHTGKTPEVIPKERGLAVFFPSSTLHECTPVTNGKRCTLVGWVYGPNFR